MSTPLFVKPVCGADKFFIAVDEARPPFVIQLVVEGRGQPAPEALFDALAASAEATPGAALRYRRDPDGERWEASAPPPLTVLDAPTLSFDRDGADCLRWPLSAMEGPTSELLYLRQAEGRSALIFRSLHAVMDGQGCLRWARDFFRCLRGEAPQGSPSPVELDSLLRQLGLPRRREPPEDAIHPFGRADLNRQASFHWRRQILPRPLHPQATGRVAVAIAALARRQAAADGHPDPAQAVVRVNLPCDLRGHFRGERSTGNLFASLHLEVAPEDRPEDIGGRVLRQLYEKEPLRPLGNPAHSPGPLAAFRIKAAQDQALLHASGRYLYSATLSHLGRLRATWLSGPDFIAESAFFVPLVGDSGCVISINGFAQHTECAVGLSGRFIRGPEQAELDTLLQTIAGAL